MVPPKLTLCYVDDMHPFDRNQQTYAVCTEHYLIANSVLHLLHLPLYRIVSLELNCIIVKYLPTGFTMANAMM